VPGQDRFGSDARSVPPCRGSACRGHFLMACSWHERLSPTGRRGGPCWPRRVAVPLRQPLIRDRVVNGTAYSGGNDDGQLAGKGPLGRHPTRRALARRVLSQSARALRWSLVQGAQRSRRPQLAGALYEGLPRTPRFFDRSGVFGGEFINCQRDILVVTFIDVATT